MPKIWGYRKKDCRKGLYLGEDSKHIFGIVDGKTMKNSIAQEIMEAHDRLAETYAGGIFRELKPNSFSYWSIRIILENIKYILTSYSNVDGILLDAGCGNGQFTEMFVKNLNIKKVIGVDFSENMLKVAKERAREKGYEDRIGLVRADLENIGFGDEIFDVVYLFGVLEHLDNPQKVIEELVRVCKVNGVIILNVPRKWSLAHITFMLFGQNPRDWGTAKRSFKIWEKARYYKFYTFGDVKRMVGNTNKCKLLERIPVHYIHVVGLASVPLHRLAKAGKLNLLDKLNRLFGYIYRIPAGEFLVIRKYR